MGDAAGVVWLGLFGWVWAEFQLDLQVTLAAPAFSIGLPRDQGDVDPVAEPGGESTSPSSSYHCYGDLMDPTLFSGEATRAQAVTGGHGRLRCHPV